LRNTCRKKGPDGNIIQPARKKFRKNFRTIAHGKNGKIMEKKLFYDKISLMQQIGLMEEHLVLMARSWWRSKTR
jgi:hypothetical protein